MAKQLQLRRGTTVQHNTFTGAVGEVTIDTDKDVVVVHDGATAGGFPSQKELVSGTNIKTINNTSLLGSGDISIIQTISVANIDEMKDFVASYDNYALNVLGYLEAGDGGGGLFYYDANSTEDDNGGTIIEPTSGSGRWVRRYNYVLLEYFGVVSPDYVLDSNWTWDATIDKSTANLGTIIDPSVALDAQGTGSGLGCMVRQYSGAVNVKWFGVDNTGATDCSSILNSVFELFNYVDFGGAENTYLLSSDVQIKNDVIITASGATIKQDSIAFSDTSPHYKALFNVSPLAGNDVNFECSGLVFLGTADDTTVYACDGIAYNGFLDPTLSVNKIKITNCTFDSISRFGINIRTLTAVETSTVFMRGIDISSNRFILKGKGEIPAQCIGLEIYSSYGHCESIGNVSNNTFEYVATANNPNPYPAAFKIQGLKNSSVNDMLIVNGKLLNTGQTSGIVEVFTKNCKINNIQATGTTNLKIIGTSNMVSNVNVSGITLVEVPSSYQTNFGYLLSSYNVLSNITAYGNSNYFRGYNQLQLNDCIFSGDIFISQTVDGLNTGDNSTFSNDIRLFKSKAGKVYIGTTNNITYSSVRVHNISFSYCDIVDIYGSAYTTLAGTEFKIINSNIGSCLIQSDDVGGGSWVTITKNFFDNMFDANKTASTILLRYPANGNVIGNRFLGNASWVANTNYCIFDIGKSTTITNNSYTVRTGTGGYAMKVASGTPTGIYVRENVYSLIGIGSPYVNTNGATVTVEIA